MIQIIAFIIAALVITVVLSVLILAVRGLVVTVHEDARLWREYKITVAIEAWHVAKAHN